MSLRLASPETPAVSPTFDIVAVHGLGGGPWSTWTHSENGKCWIKDFLPVDCEEARILSFEYQTTFALEEIVQDIQTISKSLLESLENERSEDPCRPLVFVAHSLGGIIVKDALFLAKHDQEYENTYSSTRGIVFFGTPHRGTDKAQFGSFFRGIFKIVRHAPPNTVVDELKIESPTLSRINESFRHISDSWGLVSFFEQKYMPGLNDLIVPRSSAELHRSNDVPIAIPENHINMCKFASTEVQAYRTVVRRIRKIVQRPGSQIKEEVIPSDNMCVSRPRGRQLHKTYIDRPDISSIIDEVCRESLNLRSQQPKKCLVHGIGGSGKSQICLKFFDDDRHRFYHRFWIDASNEKKLRQGFDRAADSIDLPVDKRGPEAVILWLERQTKTWLLVFDDVSADKPNNICEFLPGGGAGFILFSSRRSIGGMDKMAPVGGLSPEDASELLLKMSGKKADRSNMAVGELTEVLKYLPLAICVAGAFIRHRDYTIVQYLQEWKKHIFKDFDDSDDEVQHQKSLDATFRITIEDMRKHNQASAKVASDLLKLFAFLDHKHVSEQILQDAWQCRYDQYQLKKTRLNNPRHTWIEALETGDPKAYNDVRSDIQLALSFLEKYSLLSIDKGVEGVERVEGFESSDRQVLSIHSLIHAWMRESMEMPERQSWYTKAATILAANFQSERPMSNDLVLHLDHMRETSADAAVNIFDVRCNFSNDKNFVPSCFADIYTRHGYHVEARDLRRAMCAKLTFSDDHDYRIDCFSDLAGSYKDLGEHHNASECYGRAYSIASQPRFYQKSLKCKMQALRCTMEVAQNARDLEDYEKASKIIDAAWATAGDLRKTYPSDEKIRTVYIQTSRERAISILSFGNANYAVANHAVEMLKNGVQDYEKIAKPDNHDLLRSRGALAKAYEQVGRHKEALEERREVLRQRNANEMDQDHPDRLIAKEDVALSLVAMGELGDAHGLRAELLGDWKRCGRQIPEDYPQFLRAKMNLAHNCEVLGHWKPAKEYYDGVYECKRKLAELHHRRRCFAQQCVNHEEALLCAETHKAFGTDEAIEALEGKALAQFQLQNQNAAEQTFDMIKKIWILKLKAAPYQERKYLASLNRLTKLKGNLDKRIAFREEILALQQKGQKRTQTDTLMTMLNLGLDYYTIRQWGKVCSHLSIVLKEGETLKTMVPKEIEEAEKAYKESVEALPPPQSATSTQRPPVSTPQSPQQGNQAQARQQGTRGRGSPATRPGRGGGFVQGPRGIPNARMHDPWGTRFERFVDDFMNF